MAKTILTIRDNKLTEFKTGFLATHPVPMIEDPESTMENPLPPIPEFTEARWIKEWTKQQLFKAYKHGKRKNAIKATQVDETIIE